MTDMITATFKLLAADSVSVNRFLQGKYYISWFFSKTLVKILTVVVLLLVLLIVIWAKKLRPQSRYGSRRNKNKGFRNYRGDAWKKRKADANKASALFRKDASCPTTI